jgi:4-hydroxybenzoate polyprenyltransferase
VSILSISWVVFAAQFAALLTLYFVCSVLYSQYLKRIPVLDVLILAGLYTLRVLAGGVVAHVPVSRWLLGFSMFFFLSLAFVKRYSEMLANGSEIKRPQNGRGYYASDRDLFRTVGPVSGYISVLVFALYINSPEVAVLYRQPQYLWFLGPLLLFWITRIWLLAERGEMNQDPVDFAIRDETSYIVGSLALLIVFASI